MREMLIRGEAGSQVSEWVPSASNKSSYLSTITPYGLQIQNILYNATVVNVTTSGGFVTYTTRIPHYLQIGQTVTITNVTSSPTNVFNLTSVQVATTPTATTFTVSNAATGTYTSGGSVAPNTLSLPSNLTWIYAIVVGSGGTGYQDGTNTGGGAGGVAWGWTLATNTSWVLGTVGATGVSPISTRYGHIIAGSQGTNAVANGASGVLGAGGGGGTNAGVGASLGATNYWGIPGGTSVGTSNLPGLPGAGGGGGSGGNNKGGDGISGGGGGSASGATTGGVGGSGLVGGSGGSGSVSAGNGGNGINIITGAITLGGTSNGIRSGGGGGLLEAGGNATATLNGYGGAGGGGGGAARVNAGSAAIILYY